MKNNVVCIIQARSSSKRFPNKVLLKIKKYSLIEILVKRLKKSKKISKIVIATTNKSEDKVFKSISKKNNIGFFQGSTDNVLKRYYLCAKKFKANTVVRITSDCPLTDPVLVDKLIEKYFEYKCPDYLSNTISRTYPDGLDIEIIKFDALKKANLLSKNKLDKEHVTRFIVGKNFFKKIEYKSKENLSHLRWTVDEKDDFHFIEKVFMKFKSIHFSYKQVLKILKLNPYLSNINSHLIDNNANCRDKHYQDLNLGQKYWRRALGVIPGGNMFFSKRPNLFLPNLWPTYFNKAKGYKIWDLEGKIFKDFCFMGVGTNILGYSNNEINRFISSKIKQGNSSTLNSVEDILLSEKLIDIHNWAGMTKLCRTGAEAAAIAIRISRAQNKKNKVVVCGYHGWHDWYLAANLKNKNNLDEHLIKGIGAEGVLKDLKNSVLQFSYNDFDSLKKIIKNNKDISAVIMEVKRNNEPKNNFLKKVRDITNKNNINLIFDECTSGFRSNLGGLHLQYNVIPDLCLFGKAIGNGYPINAVIGKTDIMKMSDKTFISSTFWSERLGPSAALKTIEIMERDKTFIKIRSLDSKVRKIWKKLSKLHKIKITIEGMEGIPTFKFNYEENLQYKTYLTQEMLKKNILATNSVYLSSSHESSFLDIYANNLDKIFKNIKNCIDQKISIYEILQGPVSQMGLRQK